MVAHFPMRTHGVNKSGISICLRHLDTSKESSNPIFFRIDIFCIIRAQHVQSCYIRTMMARLYKSYVNILNLYVKNFVIFKILKICKYHFPDFLRGTRKFKKIRKVVTITLFNCTNPHISMTKNIG